MKERLVATIAILVAVAGCSQAQRPEPVSPITVRSPCNGGNRCTVDVAATPPGASCTITAPSPGEALVVNRAANGTNVKIVWNLPPGFGFCPGDGVSFKDASDQFTEGFATDDANGGDDHHPGGCKRHFRWNNRNTSTGQWRYGLKFTHAASGKPCTLDPWVVNN